MFCKTVFVVYVVFGLIFALFLQLNQLPDYVKCFFKNQKRYRTVQIDRF